MNDSEEVKTTKIIKIGDIKIAMFIDKPIGEGKYARCYLGYHCEDDCLLIIKEIKKKEESKTMAGGIKFKQNYEKELTNLITASQKYRNKEHSNIVNVYNYRILKEDHAYIIMEYCNEGTLANLLRQRQSSSFRFGEVCTIMRDLISGYRQLFAGGINHQDLKPDNIFINQGYFKIGDFGLSYKFSDKNYQGGGTEPYNAPEKYSRSHQPHFSQDIYSLGIIFYELIFGEHPYYNREDCNEEFISFKKKSLKQPEKSLSIKDIVTFNYKNIEIQSEAQKRKELALRCEFFPKFLLSKKIKKNIKCRVKVNESQKNTLGGVKELIYRMISFSAEDRPDIHKILTEFEKMELTFLPVKVISSKIPYRYKFQIETESNVEPKRLPYSDIQEKDISLNKPISLICSEAEKVNVLGNLIVDISTTIENEIIKKNIYNKCIRKLIPALHMFGYCVTYGKYINILQQISDLEKEDMELFYSTRQDYLVNNTKNNKEYFEAVLEDYFELRKLPLKDTFEILEKFIQNSFREDCEQADFAIDNNNMNCFMLMTVILELLTLDKRQLYTIEEVLKLKKKQIHLMNRFGTFKVEQVEKELEKFNLNPPLMQCNDQ